MMRWFLVFIAVLVATPATARVIIEPVRGVTLDAFGRLIRFDALQLNDQGTIISANTQTNDESLRRVHGANHVLLPAFGLAMLDAASVFGDEPADLLTIGTALDALAARGWSSVHIAGVSPQQWSALAKPRANPYPLRVVASLDGDAPNARDAIRTGPVVIGGGDQAALRGVRYRLDGPAGLRYEPPQLKNMIVRALMWKWQIVLEARSDAALSLALDAYTEILPSMGVSLRPLLHTHVMVSPEQAQAFARLGVILIGSSQVLPSLTPSAVAGGRIGIAAPNLDAAAAQTFAIPGIAPSIALQALTIDAAYALFLDGRLGTIEPGKRGDFVLLSDDPLWEALPAPPHVVQRWFDGTPRP
jgi:predicted amidohydrolase YtcJ